MGKTTRYILGVSAALLVASGIAASIYVRTLGSRLRHRVEDALEKRFDADVSLADLQFALFPFPRVDGQGLVIGHKTWAGDAHPLIKIDRFHAVTGFTTVLDWRNRVNSVTLEGLEIHVPPRGRATLKSKVEASQEISNDEPGHDSTQLKFLIETIVAHNALVEIEPKKAGKDPLRFPIQTLTMRDVGPHKAMQFVARLSNAKPPGAIDTTGYFGPWQRDDPRATPVSGDYTFRNADLSVFKGIRGILSSEGRYSGVLQHISVQGTTDTPDFDLKKSGAPVHLTARFHSVVDGANGDTILDPVEARFGNSEFICRGGVVHYPGQPGKTVELNAQSKNSRMEDILTLIVDGPPIIKGEVDFQSKIVIPPGKDPVIDKLDLNGAFHLNSAVFTSPEAAERIRMLSDRASGVSKADAEKGQGNKGDVASNMSGKFILNNGQVSLSQLAFSVPGAVVQLTGRYNLKSSEIDMKGKFHMLATLSETQSGFKQMLLKPLDPLFKKNGAGFEVPLSVTGTREHPVVGVSIFHKRFNIH